MTVNIKFKSGETKAFDAVYKLEQTERYGRGSYIKLWWYTESSAIETIEYSRQDIELVTIN